MRKPNLFRLFKKNTLKKRKMKDSEVYISVNLHFKIIILPILNRYIYI